MGMEHGQAALFDRVVIVGVGLLGCSLGLALKAHGLANHITGVGRRSSSLDTARARGAIDAASLELHKSAADASLIVIATPAALVVEKLDETRAACPPHAIVTDVASTKEAICRHAAATWPQPRRFIGSHPMAGSEQSGPEHGRAELYEGSICLVEEGEGLDAGARAGVVGLWEALGATVVGIAPDAHDTLLARTSHLPHIMAAALAAVAVRGGDIRQFIGNGFRDTTRIAAGHPEIWRDICLTNREAILAGLAELHAHLDEFTAALEAEDARTIESWFRTGQAARKQAVPETLPLGGASR